MYVRRKYNHKKDTFSAQLSYLNGTAQHRAVQCGVVPCRAVLCRALLCSLSNIPDDSASKQTELARASMSSSIFYSSFELSFSIYFGALFFMLNRYTATSSSMHEYFVVEYQNREHSTAQHNHPCTKQPSTCRSGHVSKEVCTCMHGASGLFSWNMELLAFASRLFAPIFLDHLLHLSFRSIPPCQRA